MANVTIELPTLLHHVVDGRSTIDVQASTLRGALEALVKAHPAMRVHLFDESAGLREHVLVFHNDINSRWMDSLDAPVADGDRVTIMQAVSGG